ncbi:hypothetical protein [Nocardia sp. NPDC058705]|uniref:hypothetical protein n=1 Tax=Nocardia sp. NPDC058705 TaxID=3346609 RepID=UPI0036B17343
MDTAERAIADQPSCVRRNRWLLIASAVGAVIGLTLAGGGLQHLKPLFGVESDSVMLSEPDVLQGLPRLTGPEIEHEAATVKSTYGADVDSVVATYGASNGQPELMVHVVAASLRNPETNLDRLLTDTLGTTPRDVTRVDAGPLGGIAQCATAETAKGSTALCSWVADNSFGKIVWVGASLADVTRAFPHIRGQLES